VLLLLFDGSGGSVAMEEEEEEEEEEEAYPRAIRQHASVASKLTDAPEFTSTTSHNVFLVGVCWHCS
jgi:hypothetical protein